MGHAISVDGAILAAVTQASLDCLIITNAEGRVIEFNRQKQSVWSLVGAFLKLWGHTKHSPAKMTTAQNERLSNGGPTL